MSNEICKHEYMRAPASGVPVVIGGSLAAVKSAVEYMKNSVADPVHEATLQILVACKV